MAKSYEELCFTDDFMFGKVLEDRELCRDVLECLLGEKVGELREVQTERQLRYTTDGKPIRLDVYTRDESSVYDAEMQNLNHRRAEKLELAKRSRFYQSMMDADYLQKGNSYRELPEGLRELYTFLRTGEGRSVLTKKIENAVERARRNEKWRSEYMKELLHDDDMREEGREEGLEEGIKGFIRDKLEDGVEKETILGKLRKVYGLSEEEAVKYIKCSE